MMLKNREFLRLISEKGVGAQIMVLRKYSKLVGLPPFDAYQVGVVSRYSGCLQ